MKSLFLRMRMVHWLGVALLIGNALFFTDNLIGASVQYVVAGVILLHDIDEKRWASTPCVRYRLIWPTSAPAT
jgi:methyl-accepting chemotaxis protein